MASANATDTARRFLGAYLLWQNGNASPQIRATLRATASAGLWRLLSSNRGQPTPNRRVSPERLRRLTPGAASGQVASVLAQLRTRSGLAGGLALVIKRIDGTWRVVSLGR